MMVTKVEMQHKIVEAIEKVAPGSDIYLFGSRARGDERPDSDWDVLVLVDREKVSFAFENEILNAVYDVSLETGELVSPIVKTKNNWLEKRGFIPLYENITRDGILLHQ